jgi:hypothetical protein
MARRIHSLSRLKEGRHPDTDPSFWNGYTERPAPSLPTQSVPEAYEARLALRGRLALLTVIGVPALAIVLAGLLAGRSKARRRKARLAKEASADLVDEPV